MGEPSMSKEVSRRRFLGKSLAAAAAAASFEERSLLARTERPASGSAAPAVGSLPGGLPAGRIGPLAVSRVICGGNLISGFAHSRDLIYVSPLLKHYFTDERVFATFELCEEQGINTAILRVDADIERIISRYWNERGGRIQWIAQVKPKETDLESDIRKAVDLGAVGAYVQGGVGDSFVEQGKVELLGRALEIIRAAGVVGGLGAHRLETVKACVAAGLAPDFYMKTLNGKGYWSAGLLPRNDSVWEETPEETIAFMRDIQIPWIAFKVLGAGAIHPREGFRYAFQNGADFICVGMFDFQVVEDVILARSALDGLDRGRPWLG